MNLGEPLLVRIVISTELLRPSDADQGDAEIRALCTMPALPLDTKRCLPWVQMHRGYFPAVFTNVPLNWRVISATQSILDLLNKVGIQV